MKFDFKSALMGACLVFGLFGLNSFRAPMRECLTQEQEDVLALLSVVATPDCVDGPGFTTLRVTGANFQIVNGENATATSTGVGNLIVGYNEVLNPCDRDGSHNIICGVDNNYTSFGSIVVGQTHTSTAQYNAIIGGYSNTNNADSAFMGGGYLNTITYEASLGAMIGGDEGTLRSYYGVIAGGVGNQTDDVEAASCFGGSLNYASGMRSTTVGGGNSSTFPSNTASGAFAVVTGGQNNVASGNNSSVAGGHTNTASYNNSVVSGGSNNTASGAQATVSGGDSRTSSGTADWRAGSLFEDN